MAIAKKKVGAVVMPVTRTLCVLRCGVSWIKVGIILDGASWSVRPAISNREHIYRPTHHAVPYRTFVEVAINISAKSQLRIGIQTQSPIIVTQRKTCSLTIRTPGGNAVMVSFPIFTDYSLKSRIQVGIPCTLGKCCRTRKGITVITHKTQNSRLPDISAVRCS